MSATKEKITVFFKAGYDGKCLGACHQSQRVLMLAELKLSAAVIPKFHKIPVNISRPPDSFRQLGLRRRVPALHLDTGKSDDNEPIDVADDIVAVLESRYPGGVLKNDVETKAEIATRDFFSKFCYFIRGVAKDSSHLETELRNVDAHLAIIGNKSDNESKLFLCGPKPSLLDCEVLPKLHQVRVAASGIKGYEIPASFSYLWKYLHSAYSEPSFVSSCPPDSEILIHWLDTDHPGSDKLSQRQQQLLAESSGKPPKYSFSIPVIAKRIIIE